MIKATILAIISCMSVSSCDRPDAAQLSRDDVGIRAAAFYLGVAYEHWGFSVGSWSNMTEKDKAYLRGLDDGEQFYNDHVLGQEAMKAKLTSSLTLHGLSDDHMPELEDPLWRKAVTPIVEAAVGSSAPQVYPNQR